MCTTSLSVFLWDKYISIGHHTVSRAVKSHESRHLLQLAGGYQGGPRLYRTDRMRGGEFLGVSQSRLKDSLSLCMCDSFFTADVATTALLRGMATVTLQSAIEEIENQLDAFIRCYSSIRTWPMCRKVFTLTLQWPTPAPVRVVPGQKTDPRDYLEIYGGVVKSNLIESRRVWERKRHALGQAERCSGPRSKETPHPARRFKDGPFYLLLVFMYRVIFVNFPSLNLAKSQSL